MREVIFSNNEFYHIYNRGIDKRLVTLDQEDSERFIQSLGEFNSIETIGSIYENSFNKEPRLNTIDKKLVNIVCYCLNPNHYHLLIEQLTDNGIEKFLHRLGMGYSKYFNNKYKRNGSLWQGRFKSKHIDNNEYLLRLSVYINLNDLVHQLGHPVSKLVRKSWNEYISGQTSIALCDTTNILNQFKNINEYEEFCFETLDLIKNKRMEEVADLFLE